MRKFEKIKRDTVRLQKYHFHVNLKTKEKTKVRTTMKSSVVRINGPGLSKKRIILDGHATVRAREYFLT